MHHDTDPKLVVYENTLPGVGGRRHVERYRFYAQVETIPLDGRDEPVWGTTYDISPNGVFITSSHLPQIDTIVVLKLHTEFGSLKVTARVVHRLLNLGFGCEFIDLDPEQREHLYFLVAQTTGAPIPIRTLH